ncbi:hypothetical protein ACSNOD_30815, partial [Streptomyces sp. URMC 123]
MTAARETAEGGAPAGERTTTSAPAWEGRTPFDHVYDEPDPRAFFRALGPLDYRIPHHARSIFRR